MTRVLLGEDNPVLLREIAHALEIHGYEVIQASEGQCIIDYLSESDRKPDIIVSDSTLKDAAHQPISHYLTTSDAIRGIPTLFMVAFNAISDIRSMTRNDDYIIKPFRTDDLTAAIENKLRRIYRTGVSG